MSENMRFLYFPAIPGLLLLVLVAGCLKQDDETREGPRARVAIINASLDSEPVSLVIDAVRVNEAGIAFGAASGTAENAYLPLRPGVRATDWIMGSQEPAQDKFFPWEPGAYYTMVQFDTAVGNAAPMLLFKDNLNAGDTVSRARFFNAVAGNDSLSLVLLRPRDTVRMARRQAWLGAVTSVNTSFQFRLNPGAYRLDLLNKDSVVIYTQDVQIGERLAYSFVAIGETGGTGTKAPFVLQVVHPK